MLYRKLLRPLLFRMDPEAAHHRAMRLLAAAGRSRAVARGLRRLFAPRRARAVDALGARFPSALGAAAGFDKDARALWGLYALGFGFVEVGSVTARPWGGNPAPRLFRLPADGALVNRMGLPSEGAAAVVERLRRKPPFPVLVNVAKTADPAILGDAAVADICQAVALVGPHADAVVLNLSCPNTADGVTFQDPAALVELLAAVRGIGALPPLLVKVSPDLDAAELSALLETALSAGVAGVVATNTTRSRADLRTAVAGDLALGGLSGRPLRDRALEVVRAVRERVGHDAVVVGCGGVSKPADLEAFLTAGADLVEAYTGFVYEGPRFCRRVATR